MKRYVSDTHTLFWHLTGSDKLGPNAAQAFVEGEEGNAVIYVPTIVLAELYYLNRKLRLPLDFAQTFQRIAETSHFCLIPLLPEDIAAFDSLPAELEMHDRMIARSACRLDAVLLTRDATIIASAAARTAW